MCDGFSTCNLEMYTGMIFCAWHPLKLTKAHMMSKRACLLAYNALAGHWRWMRWIGEGERQSTCQYAIQDSL